MKKIFSIFAAVLFCASMFAESYSLKNCWDGGSWEWKEMTAIEDGLYQLENVVFGGGGVNFREGATGDGEWIELAKFKGDAIAAYDTVTLVLNPTAKEITATLVGKYTGGPIYYMKNGWDGGEWYWKKMADMGDGTYKLEKVVFGGAGVNYNTIRSDGGAEWVEAKNFEGDAIGALDTVTLVLDPAAKKVAATLLGKYVKPEFPAVSVAGDFNEWHAEQGVLVQSEDKKTASIKVNLPKAQDWGFKVIIEKSWRSAADKATILERGAAPVAAKYEGGEGNNIFIRADIAGEYTITFTYADSTVAVAFPELPEVTLADGYYLVGITGWSIYALTEDQKLELTGEEKPGQYEIKGVTLKEGDEFKIAEVKDKAFTENWYGSGGTPAGTDNFKVTADFAGVCDIYFNASAPGDWNGYIWVERVSGTGVENTAVETKAVKSLENGMLIIEKNGVRYNVLGAMIR